MEGVEIAVVEDNDSNDVEDVVNPAKDVVNGDKDVVEDDELVVMVHTNDDAIYVPIYHHFDNVGFINEALHLVI